MRKILLLVPLAALALTAAGLAIAAKKDRGTSGVAFAVSASAGDTKTRTCTGADGTYQLTSTTYRGTVTGDRYAGLSAVLKLHSTLNTTKNSGFARGTLAVRGSDRREAKANVLGVYEGGVLTGILSGRDTRGADRGRLFANFSATFSGSSIALAAGSGTAANAAIVFGGTGCGAKAATTRVDARGTVASLSTTAIVVGTESGNITCSLTAAQATRLARDVKVGDRVHVRCTGGALVKLEKRR